MHAHRYTARRTLHSPLFGVVLGAPSGATKARCRIIAHTGRCCHVAHVVAAWAPHSVRSPSCCAVAARSLRGRCAIDAGLLCRCWHLYSFSSNYSHCGFTCTRQHTTEGSQYGQCDRLAPHTAPWLPRWHCTHWPIYQEYELETGTIVEDITFSVSSLCWYFFRTKLKLFNNFAE